MSEAESPCDPAPERWWLYLLRSGMGRTYVGISVDIDRRIAQHNGELPGGARSTRAGRPWVLVKRWGPYDRSLASALEYQLKRCRGPRRAGWSPTLGVEAEPDSSD